MSDTDASALSTSRTASTHSPISPTSQRSIGSSNPPSASSAGSFNPPLSDGSSPRTPSSTSGSINLSLHSSTSPISSTFRSSASSPRKNRAKNKGKARSASSQLSASPTSSSSLIFSDILSPADTPVDIRRRTQSIVRYASLYAFPALLAIIQGLLHRLSTLNITPLYNSTPLRLHTLPLHCLLGAIPAMSFLTLSLLTKTQVTGLVNPRACLTLSALGADLNLVFGRRMGIITGYLLGPRLGGLMARWSLGQLGVWAGAAFAVLCLNHVIPARPGVRAADNAMKGLVAVGASSAFVAHVYYAEEAWRAILAGPGYFMASHAEKSILVICLFLTALSLFVRSPRSTVSFAQTAHSSLTSLFSLSSKQSKSLSRITAHLPRSIAPLLFLLRIPLLILAIRQQVFLRPSPPYIAANGALRVLHSSQSLSGRILVADNLAAGYRYLRCDGSLLGGRWTRQNPNGSGVELGDSIFAAFVLQEVGILASRSDETDSLARTISLTTDLEISSDDPDADGKLQPRALVVGLGVGISASALSRRGFAVDVVEIDPAVYKAAVDYFDFHLSNTDIDTISIMPGQEYVEKIAQWDADAREKGEGGAQKWGYVIHDCFSAGMLPVEVYTSEFWETLKELVEDDGIVAVNVAGIMGSLAARRIIATLLSVFEQCRAFGEMGNEQESKELMNMVVLCTMAQTPLLSFRPPTRQQILRSPARSHMYTHFLQREISLDEVVSPSDVEDPGMIITSNGSMVGMDQIPTALATWRAMQTSG